nr:Chain Y, Trans-Golgi network integral membrane protein TGN38 peptide [Mus musculus]7RWA_y Chain y, Trans-Golgi network integral membrane protein TGN38 peptide [Mus musculus]
CKVTRRPKAADYQRL